MEATSNVGESRSNDAEEGASSIRDDNSRSSSASSASVSSTSSADLSSEEHNDIDRNEHGSFGRDQKQSEKGLPNLQKPASSSTLQSPPIQTMERPPKSSQYRFPSHVFAANNPMNPNKDWSITSNDSLFSIHNMSFTREEFNLLLKSGELGMYGDILKSGELGNLYKSGELPSPLIDALKTFKDQMPTKLRQDMHKSQSGDNSISEVTDVKEANPSMEELTSPASVSRDTESYAPSFASHVVAKSERQSSVSLTPVKSERSSSGTSSLRTSEVDIPKKNEFSFDSYQEEKSKQESYKPEETTSPASSSSWLSCCGCCGKTS